MASSAQTSLEDGHSSGETDQTNLDSLCFFADAGAPNLAKKASNPFPMEPGPVGPRRCWMTLAVAMDGGHDVLPRQGSCRLKACILLL